MNDIRDGDSSTIPSGSPDALPCRNERVHHAEIRLTKDAMDATDRHVAPRRHAKGRPNLMTTTAELQIPSDGSTSHGRLADWVAEVAALTTPDRISWVTGSAEA